MPTVVIRCAGIPYQLKVIQRKIEAGKYEVLVNGERAGEVFKEWSGDGNYRWSHSKVLDRDVVEGKGNWKTRRKAAISLLIEHFWGEDSYHKKMLEELWND